MSEDAYEHRSFPGRKTKCGRLTRLAMIARSKSISAAAKQLGLTREALHAWFHGLHAREGSAHLPPLKLTPSRARKQKAT